MTLSDVLGVFSDYLNSRTRATSVSRLRNLPKIVSDNRFVAFLASIIYWGRELFWHRFFHTQGQQLQGFVYRFARKRCAEFDKSPRFIMLMLDRNRFQRNPDRRPSVKARSSSLSRLCVLLSGCMTSELWFPTFHCLYICP